MTEHPVCPVSALAPGDRKLITVDGIEIGVFNIDGEYYALRNVCPHKRAPLCRGQVTGLPVADSPDSVRVEREGEILRCPWHGWEFDITDGSLVVEPDGMRARTYDVSVQGFADENERTRETTDAGEQSRENEDTGEHCRTFENAECLDDVEAQTYDVTIEDEIVVVHV